MNMIKFAMVGAVTLSTALASAAVNAEPVRAAAATPGVVSVKKIKALRTAAPHAREARAVSGTDIGLGLLAGAAAGFGLYEATKNTNDSPAG